jgi:hypothetical protein
VRSSTSAETERPDPDLPQDPGIPGTKAPEELPPQDEPEVERVPDSDQPDVDDEGQMAPDESQRFASAEIRMYRTIPIGTTSDPSRRHSGLTG